MVIAVAAVVAGGTTATLAPPSSAGVARGGAPSARTRAVGRNAVAPSAASNRARAVAEAGRLLGLLELPPTAVVSASEPAGDNGLLASPSYDEAAPNLVDAHRWWTVPKSPAAVLAYVAAHLPAGVKFSGAGGGTAPPGFSTETFTLPPIPGVLGQRVLAVTAVPLSATATAVRTDGEAVWITPRPASEQIPASVRSVTFTASGETPGGGAGPVSALRTLTGARARRLVTFLNGLEIVQPGARSCPAAFFKSVHLSFFTGSAAGGKPVTRAVEEATGCAFVSLSIGGRTVPALQDYPSVTGELERLGAIPVCSPSQLEPSATLPVRGAGGRLISFLFRNRSDSACRLSGFPRLALFDAHGRSLRLAVTDQQAAIVNREGFDAAVSLDPEQSASFGVTWSRCDAPHAVRVRITLPGVTRRMVLAVGARARPFAPCRGQLSVGNLTDFP